MSIGDNWHVGIDGRAGPHREPIPEVQVHFDRLTARIAELEGRLDEIAGLAERYQADELDNSDKPSSWGKLAALVDAALRARK